MPLRVRCKCGETLTMPDNKAGMEVMCPLCDQLITIPSSRKVVPPPPPKPEAPVAAKATPPAVPATHPKSKPVVPPPLKKAVKGPKPGREAAVAKDSAPPPKSKTPSGGVASDGDASRSGKKDSPKPVPKPRTLAEQQVPSPAKPPGPPPRKSATTDKAKSDSNPSVKAKQKSEPAQKHHHEEEQRNEEKQAPVPPPLKRDSKSQSPVAAPKHPPVAPPAASPSPKTSPVSPAKTPPAISTAVAAGDNVPADPKPDPRENVRGVEHDPGKKWTVYQLGACLAVLACVGMIPGILEVVRHTQDFDSRGIERFAYFVFFFSGIQLIYAFYMVQLPDWSTARVVMVVSALVSVLYAISMGIALMGGNDNAIIAAFGLSAQQTAGYVSMWCCLMTLLMSLLTYFLVRTSLRWQRAYELTTAGR